MRGAARLLRCHPFPTPPLPAHTATPAGKDVVIVGVRRILPPAKHSRRVERPRTRTLTSVHEVGAAAAAAAALFSPCAHSAASTLHQSGTDPACLAFPCILRFASVLLNLSHVSCHPILSTSLQAYLDDLVYPTEIVGKRIRYRCGALATRAARLCPGCCAFASRSRASTPRMLTRTEHAPSHPYPTPTPVTLNRLDGSKVLKVLLDPKDRNSAEYKVRHF